MFSALDIQDELQTLYTSGTVFHAFLGEKLPDWRAAANLVRTIAETHKLPYYTISPTYSVCKNHGYLSGEQYECPDCGETTEVYSRITGYYRPVQNWNEGKAQEFKDRKIYKVEKSSVKIMDASAPENANKKPSEPVKVTAVDTNGKELLLFTTKTCPNCKVAKSILEDAGVVFKIMDVESNMDLAKKYEIKQAPTLIVADGTTVEKLVSAPDIKKFAMAQ
jgi:ribonucleoside-triphosphate reductase